jgi:hypothetical protein
MPPSPKAGAQAFNEHHATQNPPGIIGCASFNYTGPIWMAIKAPTLQVTAVAVQHNVWST